MRRVNQKLFHRRCLTSDGNPVFNRMSFRPRIAEFGIGSARFELMAKNAVNIGGLQNAYVSLPEKDVGVILQMILLSNSASENRFESHRRFLTEHT